MADGETAGSNAATTRAPTTALTAPASAQSATVVAAANSSGAEQDQGHGSDSEDSDEDLFGSDYSYESYDSDISEHTTYSLEGEGLCVWSFESAYLSSPPTSKYAWHCRQVDYDRCSPRELKRFVVNRGLKDPYPEGITLKSLYISVLVKADKNKRFRFMDLPAEMRNLVYGEVLAIPEDVGACLSFCFPQILRVSRQVHLEASDVIHAINEVKIRIGLDVGMYDHVIGHVQIGKQVHSSTHRFVSLTTGPSEFPQHLRRAENLSIGLLACLECASSGDLPGHSGLELLSRCLLNLATFLMDGHRLKHLKIMLDSSFQKSFARELLFPLRRLRNISRVSIVGSDLDQIDIDSIKTAIGTSSPVFNTYKHFALLGKEIEAWSELPWELHDTEVATEDDSESLGNVVMDAEGLLESIEHGSMWRGGWRSEAGEKQMQRDLAEVERWLNIASASGLMKAMCKVVMATEQRQRTVRTSGSIESVIT
ncbi:hypothetical protein EJ03DRAFT_352655 [Teratosphaeria nubilosa]|uniref:F-box domain-containing protein n=1 Tax=Teratosphaeria nubilosa TaxID=161662 RepID=A0A6G1L4Q0_9PEZI|nr:hypothetical protein EJ03DRAFT_352655 [Teratosphaeria nubilosa]